MKSLQTIKQYVAKSAGTGPEVGEVRKSPGLFECSGCSQVFITSPSECSRCGGDEFTRVADFRSTS